MNQVTSNAALQAAGVSVTAGATSLTFSSNHGQNFSVSSSGDVTNGLGLGNYVTGANSAFDYTTVTGGVSLSTQTTTDTLEFSIAGGTVQQITVSAAATGSTGAGLAVLINSQIGANAALAAAGLKATGVAATGGAITIASTNGTYFRLAEGTGTAVNQILGFGVGAVTNALTASGNAGVQTSAASSTTNDLYFNAGGTSATNAFQFNNIQNGQDTQTVSFGANDATGAAHSLAVVLSNNATSRNGESLDETITSINAALQTSNDSTLQSIVAVKDNIMSASGTVTGQGIRFLSSLTSFTVSVSTAGSNGTVGIGKATEQGVVQTAAQLAGGGTADVSNQSTAQAAVTALATAVTLLGSAQAVVGRGENEFTYATNLAQSQLTNTAAAEASIRDADMASEAANLTKAQILVQAGVAALAQANSAPQQVLTLLRS
jgi:flagellin